MRIAYPLCQRPYSIRTRIKTQCIVMLCLNSPSVRDHIPLEQGLRLPGGTTGQNTVSGQRPYSIRTRIKTLFADTVRHLLRQRPYSIRTRIKTRRWISVFYGSCPGQRPYSIRTRIKTRYGAIVHFFFFWSETIFH